MLAQSTIFVHDNPRASKCLNKTCYFHLLELSPIFPLLYKQRVIVTTFFKVLRQIKVKNRKVFNCGRSKNIFFTIGLVFSQLPLFLRQKEYLFFLFLRFDIVTEQLAVASCLICLMIKLAFWIFEGFFF